MVHLGLCELCHFGAFYREAILNGPRSSYSVICPIVLKDAFEEQEMSSGLPGPQSLGRARHLRSRRFPPSLNPSGRLECKPAEAEKNFRWGGGGGTVAGGVEEERLGMRAAFCAFAKC